MPLEEGAVEADVVPTRMLAVGVAHEVAVRLPPAPPLDAGDTQMVGVREAPAEADPVAHSLGSAELV